MNTHSKATALEKLDCVAGVACVLLRTVFSSLRYPFLSAFKSQPTFGREVIRLLIRGLLDRLNVAQLQWVLPSTTSVYKQWIESNSAAEDAPMEVRTEPIGDDGAKLHWVGNIESKKVILHFHGGGFAMPMSPGHLNFISYLRREVKRRSGVEVKTAFLEYTLVPAHKYPTQFRQAVLALQHVINSGISPTDIVISGDSAGGQLTLQVLSHILHPHPAIPRIQLSVPLAGILAMSPWVIFKSGAKSFVNNDKDVISIKPLLEWGKIISDGTTIADGKAEPGGFWGEPLKAPPEWWQDTAKASRNVMIIYGAFEAFADDNAELAKKMREGVAGHGKVNITDAEEPRGLHIGPIIDASRGRTPNDFSKATSLWVNDVLLP